MNIVSPEVAAWQQTFDGLQSEWEALQGPRLDAWEKLLADIVGEERMLRRQGQWIVGPVDFLSIIGLNRREACHADLLAWLLTPCAPHGLKTGLLHEIMQTCFPEDEIDPEELYTATFSRELRGARGTAKIRTFADIVIRSEAFTLVIEVKVGAGEQGEQCDRLYSEFCRDHPRTRFLFLTPTGTKPRTATGAAKDAFRQMNFVRLRQLLNKLANDVAPEVRSSDGFAVVRNYLATLHKEFS